MDFWTFITIAMIIYVLDNVRSKADRGFQTNTVREVTKKEIDDLKQRVNELEKFSKISIEKRHRAVETIVVDSDYHLTMKFKELLEDDNN